jgi:hypothetical protein
LTAWLSDYKLFANKEIRFFAKSLLLKTGFLRPAMKFTDIPTEQSTAITDAILALLALGCLWYLRRIGQSDPLKTNLWLWIFGLLALAAILGTIAHGFQMSARLNHLFWQPLYLSLGLTVALFVVAVVYDMWGYEAARRVLPVMLVIGVAFYGVTVLIPGSFLVFIIYEAMAMLFALGIYGWLAWQGQLNGAWLMTAGILITIIAAGVQASEAISVTIIWPFDHNGLYHLIQMLGLLVLVAGLRAALLAEPSPYST